MKYLYLILLLIISSCSGLGAGLGTDKIINKQYYYSIDNITGSRKESINDAIKYFEKTIDCVSFKEIPKDNIVKNRIYFISLDYMPDPTIGDNSELFNLELIFISNYEIKDNKLMHIDDNKYIRKIALHEMAHALGMPAQHPFERNFSNESLLTPQIEHTSPEIFTDMDVQYLHNLICK